MNWTTIVPMIASALSALAAVLAWLAKLRWSQEFAAAKDETIKSKEAQIAALHDQNSEMIKTKDAHISVLREQLDSLREMLSGKTREYFKTTKETLEEYVTVLQADVHTARAAADEKDRQLKALQASDSDRDQAIARLTEEKAELQARADDLAQRLSELPSLEDRKSTDNWLDAVSTSSSSLANSLGTTPSRFAYLSQNYWVRDRLEDQLRIATPERTLRRRDPKVVIGALGSGNRSTFSDDSPESAKKEDGDK